MLASAQVLLTMAQLLRSRAVDSRLSIRISSSPSSWAREVGGSSAVAASFFCFCFLGAITGSSHGAEVQALVAPCGVAKVSQLREGTQRYYLLYGV